MTGKIQAARSQELEECSSASLERMVSFSGIKHAPDKVDCGTHCTSIVLEPKPFQEK